MKKITIAVYSILVLLMLITAVLYSHLYRSQIDYSSKLLDRQVLIAGTDIDHASLYIVSDLAEIDFSDDITRFFSDPDVNERAKEKLKLYYSKYGEIVVGLMLYNTEGDVYTLFKDEEGNSWLDGTYKAQTVPFIHARETLEPERDKYRYFQPVLKDGKVLGNIVVTIDFSRYFSRIFSKYNIESYQWQWVLNDTGAVLFDNSGNEGVYTHTGHILDELIQGNSGRTTHSMRDETLSREILSSYYPVTMFGLDFGIVFSAPTDFYRKQLVRNFLILGLVTLCFILCIILLFSRFIKRKSQLLHEKSSSESDLTAIIEQMPAGIVIYNKAGEILAANKMAAGLFSYEDHSAMKGKLMPDLSRYEYQSGIGKEAGRGKIISLPSGESDRMVYAAAVPLIRNGESHTLELFFDITSIELARRQEADAHTAKSGLLDRMSFEIRTPLNGILGMTEMLSRTEIPKESAEIVQLLSRSADLLLNIVNDIFDVSKTESGRMILDEIPFRLREEVAWCINLIKRQNMDAMVRFESVIDEAVPDNLIGDPYRLRQVITNLLNNSIAGTRSGKIRIECRSRDRTGYNLMLDFTITDNGNTYTRAELKRMFGDYITIMSQRSEWNEELQLGPLLARQLTELMGGELTAESPAQTDVSGRGEGLRVSFSVRMQINEKINKNIDLRSYTNTSDLRTLVIAGSQARDDDFLGIMHKTGLPVSVTSFQKHTVSQIRTSLADQESRYILLVIFDDPERDGFEIARSLRDNGLADQHVVLMFTSSEPKGYYARCVETGVDHLLVKPFAPEDLMNTLREFFPDLRDKSVRPDSVNNDTPHILVVDDNYLNRKVTGSLLKVMGVVADFAAGGKEAIDLASEKPYDLIFMDLIMPDTDGFEATRKILSFRPDATILALSADTMAVTRERVEEAGMKELVEKPVTFEELKRVIEKYHKPVSKL